MLFSTAAGASPRVFASPLARQVAKSAGIDIAALLGKGTGPGGRILRGDVAGFLSSGAPAVAVVAPPAAPAAAKIAAPQPAAAQTPVAPPPSGDFQDFPHTDLRRSIASRLTQSKQTVPHYTLTADINLDAVLGLRAKLNAKQKDENKLTLNDFFIKAAALALRKVPEVNSSWLGDVIRTYDYVDISVSTSTPDGTVAPVVRDADAKGLGSISSSVRSLTASALAGSLGPADVDGATFTIVNLGAYGVRQFSSIISPPQAAVLAIGTVAKRVIPNPDPKAEAVFATSTQVSVTLSCDHRVVDGAVGATWLSAFKELLQDPDSMLL